MSEDESKAPSPLRSAGALQNGSERQRLAAEAQSAAERERGSITHEAPNATSAVILASGTYGGVDGPSGIYKRLAERLKESGITCIRLDYQNLHTVDGCVRDVSAVIEELRSKGVKRVVLVGWSFGGAVVANAAVASEDVVGVAMIASQKQRADVVAQLSPRPLLLLHGTADRILPDSNSLELFELAGEPKQLMVFPGADHFFEGHEAKLRAKLFAWCCDLAGKDL
jgi:uncharacterized protein